MFKKATDRQNTFMWCRMFNSRAYHMAGAFACMSVRLKTK